MSMYTVYYRVSTKHQGAEGLGIEAQRSAVAAYAGENGIAREFVEVESGKRNDRPQLQAALDYCKRHKTKLLIAKLDRLARNVFTIARIMESGVEFVAVDQPHANKFTLHILAAVAEYEADAISKRTREALQAKKRGLPEGQKLGNPNFRETLKDGRSVQKAKRADFYARTLPVIQGMKDRGLTFRQIVDELNRLAVPTFRGTGVWGISSVQAVLAHGSKDQEA